jgi:UDP-N-acetylglucosamine:LPS N-acetylglucosamine transferase
MKLCFAASLGGHLEEIACLREITLQYDTILLTEKSDFQELKLGQKTYYVRQTNRREPLFILYFILIFIKSYLILIKERPNCIISTGALITYPICILGKLMGKKVIYIESFARIDKPSLTGRFMYHVADLFIVQWEELLIHYPNAVYTGGIF